MSWRPDPVPLADTEALVIAHLADLIPDASVRPDFVGWTEDALWVMVTRTGGNVIVGGRAEAVSIDVQAIAPSKPQAWDLASAVSMAFLTMPSMVGGIVSVTPSGSWAHVPMPDTVDGPSRYAAAFTVLASGTPPVV